MFRSYFSALSHREMSRGCRRLSSWPTPGVQLQSNPVQSSLSIFIFIYICCLRDKTKWQRLYLKCYLHLFPMFNLKWGFHASSSHITASGQGPFSIIFDYLQWGPLQWKLKLTLTYPKHFTLSFTTRGSFFNWAERASAIGDCPGYWIPIIAGTGEQGRSDDISTTDLASICKGQRAFPPSAQW